MIKELTATYNKAIESKAVVCLLILKVKNYTKYRTVFYKFRIWFNIPPPNFLTRLMKCAAVSHHPCAENDSNIKIQPCPKDKHGKVHRVRLRHLCSATFIINISFITGSGKWKIRASQMWSCTFGLFYLFIYALLTVVLI